MGVQIDVLLVGEDDEDTARLLQELERGGLYPSWGRVSCTADLERALSERSWDVVLADDGSQSVPTREALALVQQITPRTPVIVLSGAEGEHQAAELMRAGAHDCVPMAGPARLVPAIERELAEAAERERTERTLHEVEVRLDEIATRDRLLAEENARLHQEAEESVRARAEFLAVTAHELKTPLTPIRMQVQSLKRGLDRAPAEMSPERLRARISAVDRAAARLERLVDTLLDVSEMTVGNITLERRDVDLSEIAAAVVSRMRAEIERTGSGLTLWAEDEVRGDWDACRLSRALGNLLSNAMKYGEGKPIVVTVEGDERSGRVSVRDNGVGMTAEERARLFDRFERRAPIRHYSGFGLGLWVVRQIAEAHGGRVEMWSRPGEGSRFTVELPRRAPAEEG